MSGGTNRPLDYAVDSFYGHTLYMCGTETGAR
jgi:hypothetical protein